MMAGKDFCQMHSRFLPTIAVFFLILAPLTLAAPAFGMEEAAGGGHWKEWLWKILNFAVLVFIIVKFAGKPFRDFLRKRTELIEKTLQEAKEAKALAEKALTEVQERLKSRDSELAEIARHAEQSAQRERDSLIEQGERMSGKIVEQAKNNIEHEVRLARESIKAEAVAIAMELAEKKLKEKLSKDEQARLIEESMARMEKKQ